MTIDPSALDDERVADFLAECDEALAAGEMLGPFGAAGSVDGTHIERSLACIKLLREVLTKSSGADAARCPPATSLPERRAGLPFERIGRYEIKRELGHGSYGIVFLAHDPQLHRDVALKIPRSEAIISGRLRERFLREARAAAVLNHPNVIAVHEAGVVGPVCYISAEFCNGVTLGEWFKARRDAVPVRQAAGILATLALAVADAHARGIVHRDLKPANIMLEARNAGADADSLDRALCLLNPKITDFGLAKFFQEEDAASTQSGAIIGTPQYMAPEQARGKGKLAGPAADIYALGAILYELLTGRPPFQGETTLDTIHQVLLVEPALPRRLRPSVPRDLEAVCLKCLEKEPHRRYPSAVSLAEDLRRFVENRPTLARPIGVSGRCLTWARRQPALAAVLALLFLVAGLGLGGITWQWRAASTVHVDRERHLYLNRVALAERALSLNNPGRAEPLLAECPSELRQWEWHYLKRLCHADGLSLQANDQSIECLAFDPVKRELATAGTDGFLRLWDLGNGLAISRMHGHTKRLRALAYSADGRWIATGADDLTVVVWNASTGAKVGRISGFSTTPMSVCFSPDTSRLAIACLRGRLTFWNTANWKEASSLPAADGTLQAVAHRPDGRVVATGHRDGLVRLWDAERCREIRRLRGHVLPIESLAFSRDGRCLASSSNDMADFSSGEAKVWDLDTGRELFTLRGHTGPVSKLAFSADSRRLATSSWDKTVKIWDTSSGEELLTIRNQIDRLYCVAFSPDGRKLASVGNRGLVQVCDATPVPEHVISSPRFEAEGSDCVAFSPDGRFLISGGAVNTIGIWNASTGAQLANLRGHAQPVVAVACTPDGRQFISASRDKTIRIWNTEAASRFSTLTGHDDWVNGLAMQPGGGEFASASSDHTIRRWALPDFREIGVLRVHDLAVYSLAYSPDGRRIASASEDRTCKISDLATGRVLCIPWRNTDRITGVVFHPDGGCVAALCGVEGVARVFDASSGRDLKSIRGVSGENLAFNRDGSRLACAGSARDVRVWDTKTWEENCILRGPTGDIRVVAFSPDGRRVASASYDGTVLVWDLPEAVPDHGQ